MIAILLSGGIDSTCLAYWKRPEYGFTVDYGQVPAKGEIRAATYIANKMGINHEVLRVDCRGLGSGDLAGSQPLAIAPVSEWWPFRNQLLITIAAMRAVSLQIELLMVGSIGSDDTHADGRPTFFKRMDEIIHAQEGGLRIKAPGIHVSSLDLVKESHIPISFLHWTFSCHRSEYACGNCRGCNKRSGLFTELANGNN